jgi:hypothetical protein
MCDYSLMAIPNRLATEGEELVSHRFQTGSMGLAAASAFPKNPNPPEAKWRLRSLLDIFFNARHHQAVAAVCIPPGSRLMLQDIPARAQKDYMVGPEEEVTFFQISAMENTYRDAVRFRNGKQMRLQELHEGQRVTVLDLGNAEDRMPVNEEAHSF